MADLITARTAGFLNSTRVSVYRGLGGGFSYEPLRSFVGRDVSGFADLDGDGDPDGFGERLISSREFDGPEDGIIRQYGDGSPGTGGAVPVAGSRGPVRPGSTTAELRLRLGLGGAPAFLVIGTGSASVDDFAVPGFTLYVSPILTIVPVPLSGAAGAAGQGDFSLNTTPLIATVTGLSIYHQFAILDAGAANGVAFTNGLEITYGL